jgi:hypothetical protein
LAASGKPVVKKPAVHKVFGVRVDQVMCDEVVAIGILQKVYVGPYKIPV